MEIKGEYEIEMIIRNMFNSYSLTIRDSNIVTNNGLNFILQVLGGETEETLGEVHVGKNTTEASPLDTLSSFDTHAVEVPKTDVEVENNKLTYIIHTTGDVLNETTEIGIWSSDEQVLVTRDVHGAYDMPSSAEIKIKYSLTLTNKIEEENSNDQLSTSL